MAMYSTVAAPMPGAIVATILGHQVKTALGPAGGPDYWLIGGVVALIVGVVIGFRKRAMQMFAKEKS